MNETLHKFRSRAGRHPAAQLRLGCGVNENCPVMDIIFTFLRYVDSTWRVEVEGRKRRKAISACLSVASSGFYTCAALELTPRYQCEYMANH